MKHIYKKRKGYTLVEVMFVVLVFTIAMGMSLPFLTEVMRSLIITESRNLINGDIRQVTSEVADNAREANYFRIYTSFNNHTPQLSGQAGDFLLLVYLVDFASDSGWVNSGGVMTLTTPREIDRVVAYYRNANANNKGPVNKVEWDVTGLTFNEILNEINAAALDGRASTEEVLELAEGLANQQLFYNYMDTSIMINGNIIHGDENVREVTNTYNFTVSPKGKSQ